MKSREPPWKRSSCGDVGVGLVDRLGARVRPAAEVDVVAAEAALHRPVGGDRRVDPAREEHERPSRDADREAAAAGDLLREGEDLALVDLDEDLEVGAGQVDAEPEFVLDGAADGGRELARVEPEALVAPSSAHGERRARTAAQELDGSGARGLGRLLEHERGVQEARAEQVPCPLDEDVRGRRRQHRERTAALTQLERPEIPEQPDDVPAEPPVEQRAVPALQHDLAELDQDAATHRPTL